MTASAMPPWRSAQITPATVPTRRPSTSPPTAIVSVLGSRSASSTTTGRWVRNEVAAVGSQSP